MNKRKILGIAALAALAIAPPARAELSELKVAQQYGISYLPLMIMEDQGLIEKHAKAAGIGDLKVSWSKFAGGNVMNEALLSGSLQFASGGVGPLVTLWAKTRGNYDVKAVAAMNSMPLYLNTRNPDVRTVKDFTDKDKIALPAVKVSIQAVTLQMAAEKAFGEGQHRAAREQYHPFVLVLLVPEPRRAGVTEGDDALDPAVRAGEQGVEDLLAACSQAAGEQIAVRRRRCGIGHRIPRHAVFAGLLSGTPPSCCRAPAPGPPGGSAGRGRARSSRCPCHSGPCPRPRRSGRCGLRPAR